MDVLCCGLTDSGDGGDGGDGGDRIGDCGCSLALGN